MRRCRVLRRSQAAHHRPSLDDHFVGLVAKRSDHAKRTLQIIPVRRCHDRKPDPAGALAADEGSVGWCQANALFARPPCKRPTGCAARSEEHTSELQSLMRISYAVFCLKKKTFPFSPIYFSFLFFLFLFLLLLSLLFLFFFS